MEEIFNKLEEVNDKIQKLQDKDENKTILLDINKTLNMLAAKVEEVIVNQEYMEESIKYIDDDLVDIQEELYEEVTIDDLCEIKDEYVEINCKNCSKPIFVEDAAMDKNKVIPCPFCGESAI